MDETRAEEIRSLLNKKDELQKERDEIVLNLAHCEKSVWCVGRWDGEKHRYMVWTTPIWPEEAKSALGMKLIMIRKELEKLQSELASL